MNPDPGLLLPQVHETLNSAIQLAYIPPILLENLQPALESCTIREYIKPFVSISIAEKYGIERADILDQVCRNSLLPRDHITTKVMMGRFDFCSE